MTPGRYYKVKDGRECMTTLNEDRFVQILKSQGNVLYALSAGGDVYRFVSARWDEDAKKTVPGFWKRLPNVRKDEEIIEGRPKWLKKQHELRTEE